jgi:hypothetical protein
MEVSAQRLWLAPLRPAPVAGAPEAGGQTSPASPAQPAGKLRVDRFHGLNQIGFDLGQFLSANTRGALNDILEDKVDPRTAMSGAITSYERVALMIVEQAQASERSGPASAATYLTESDFAFLKRASGGYNHIVNPDGSSFWINDRGEFPDMSDPQFAQAFRLAAQMDTDRMVGNLTGEISADYLRDLMARSKMAGGAFDPAFLDDWLALI